MEGGDGRRKRQRAEEDAVPAVPGEVRDGEVEEQVEKFFALLRSVREMRELRQGVGRVSVIPRKRAKVNNGSPWTPTFQWEDFAVAVSSRSPAGVPAMEMKEGRREKETKEEEGASLDLKLSL